MYRSLEVPIREAPDTHGQDKDKKLYVQAKCMSRANTSVLFPNESELYSARIPPYDYIKMCNQLQ